MATTLRAIEIPPLGGDTVFANTASAYAKLSPQIQDLVVKLWVVHTNIKDWLQRREERSVFSENEEIYRDENIFTSRQPLVHVHPETGERCLMTGDFARRIPELSPRESFHLLEMLQEAVTEVQNTVRWRWSVGDVAMWDNRATQHFGVSDYGFDTRVLNRVTIAGSIPVSVSGEPATMIKGDVTKWLEDAEAEAVYA
jgi:taurine dioxygenase